MEKKNDGGNAYPTTEEKSDCGVSYLEYSEGMTLRDYFAGQAIINLVPDPQMSDEILAEQAYKIADAMLKERDK